MQLCVCGDASKGSKEDAKNKNSRLLGGKTPALQAAQLAVQSKLQREKKTISDIVSDQYIFDHFFDIVKLFRKAGQKTAEACPNRNLFFSPSPSVFVFLCSSSSFSPHFDEELPKIAIGHK
jgi:hypothetical protein